MSLKEFAALPSIESCRLIRFEKAYVKNAGPAQVPTLFVEGTAPCWNMEVSLSPKIYIRCPEYWGIEVVGCLPGGFCLTAVKPFQVSRPLVGIIGSKGVEVIGGDRSEEIEVKGGCQGEVDLASY